MRVNELFDLSGKTALVTGGGRGIGRMIAQGLAEAGADLIIASRKLENCQQVAREIEKLGRNALALQVDMREEASVRALAERALAETERLEILVNNAGVTWGAPALDYPMEGWDRVFDVNVRGLWILTQAIARHMRDIGGGSILNITSVAAFKGTRDDIMPAIAYNSSKGAVTAMTTDLAIKLAEHKIRVNALAPGPFMTDMLAWVEREPEVFKAYKASIPLQCLGEEDDIKGAAVFLVSRASGFITGQTLGVDGGVLAT